MSPSILIGPQKLDHYKSLQLMYTMMQKGNPHIKMFSTLSVAKMLCWIYQLTILCASPVKQYRTKNNDSSFTCYSHLPVLQLKDIIKAWSDPYIGTFIALSGVNNLFWISLQLDILCRSAVKQLHANNNNSSSHAEVINL